MAGNQRVQAATSTPVASQGLAQGTIGAITPQLPSIGALPERRQYIDWARGIAVLIMLEAHTLDAWIRDSFRHSSTYYTLNMLGGFAAPLFLWLAGLALVMAAERRLTAGADRHAAAAAIVRRGAIIFLLAFLFRLQAFVISPGSWPITIFRVDILNVMGPSIAVTGLVWGWAGNRHRAIGATTLASIVIAMSTPLIRHAQWIDSLPLWFQWHLRPFGDHTTFTLFPWSGFVFAGAACGGLIFQLSRYSQLKVHALVFAAGGLLVALGFYTSSLPSIYTASSFWTSSPTYFAIRVGGMMTLLAMAYFVTPVMKRLTSLAGVLATFGANSLFIYWIHVELAYGYATWPIRHRLPFWAYVAAYLAFCALMLGAIRLRDRVVALWKQPHSTSQTTVVPA